MKKTPTIILITLLICASYVSYKLMSSGKTSAGTGEINNDSYATKKETAAPTKTISGDLNISGNLDSITTAPEARWKTYTNNTYGFSVGYPYGTTILENGAVGADVNFNDGNVEVLIAGGSSYCKESLNANETERVGERTFRVSRTPYTAHYYYQYSNIRCFRFIFRQLDKDIDKVNGLVNSYLTSFKVSAIK